MDYFIIASLTCAGLYFHWWLYVRIKRWADRDLALSMAGKNAAKKDYEVVKKSSAVARPSPGVRGKARYAKSRGV